MRAETHCVAQKQKDDGGVSCCRCGGGGVPSVHTVPSLRTCTVAVGQQHRRNETRPRTLRFTVHHFHRSSRTNVVRWILFSDVASRSMAAGRPSDFLGAVGPILNEESLVTIRQRQAVYTAAEEDAAHCGCRATQTLCAFLMEILDF